MEELRANAARLFLAKVFLRYIYIYKISHFIYISNIIYISIYPVKYKTAIHLLWFRRDQPEPWKNNHSCFACKSPTGLSHLILWWEPGLKFPCPLAHQFHPKANNYCWPGKSFLVGSCKMKKHAKDPDAQWQETNHSLSTHWKLYKNSKMFQKLNGGIFIIKWQKAANDKKLCSSQDYNYITHTDTHVPSLILSLHWPWPWDQWGPSATPSPPCSICLSNWQGSWGGNLGMGQCSWKHMGLFS